MTTPDTTDQDAAAKAKADAEAAAKAKAKAEADAKAEKEAAATKAKADAEAKAKEKAAQAAKQGPVALSEIRLGRRIFAIGEPLPNNLEETVLGELKAQKAI